MKDHNNIKKDEAIANANLIAAASELLSACEVALKTLNELAAFEDEIDNDPGREILNKIERAINKAKGDL